MLVMAKAKRVRAMMMSQSLFEKFLLGTRAVVSNRLPLKESSKNFKDASIRLL